MPKNNPAVTTYWYKYIVGLKLMKVSVKVLGLIHKGYHPTASSCR